MDSYLESLVKKSEEIEDIEEAPAEEVEDAVEVADTSDDIVEENDAVEEEVTEEPEEKVEETKEVKKAEPVVEKGAPVVKNSPVTKLEDGATISVSEVRIFNIPDSKQPSKIVTGNVISRNEVTGANGEAFILVDYMRPGFGLVKGYMLKN